jgi:Sulfotransferase family
VSATSSGPGGEAPGSEQELLEELRGAGAAGATLPEFFVVGHAKSGTTALHGMLQSHPQIFLPVLRETQFLARGPRERSEQPAAGQEARRPRTLAAYLALFEDARPGQRIGEISTAYLRTPETAARIAALRPDARIIAFFREPASFLRSLHLQLLQVGFETERDFARALALEDDRLQGRKIPPGCPWPRALLYGEQVRYAEQLRSYRELFGTERVLALVYEDFRADNDGVVREVLRFLEVDDSVEIAPAEANPTVMVRSRRAGRLLGSVSTGEGALARSVRSTVKAFTPAGVRRGALQAARKAAVDSVPPPPDERLMGELRSRFKGEVVAAGDALGRDLVALWGYREVD